MTASPLPAKHPLHDLLRGLYDAVHALAESREESGGGIVRDALTRNVASDDLCCALDAAIDWDRGSHFAAASTEADGKCWVQAFGKIRGVSVMIVSPHAPIAKVDPEACGDCVAASSAGELLCRECGAVR